MGKVIPIGSMGAPRERGDVAQNEVKVLEKDEQGQIEDEAANQPQLCPAQPALAMMQRNAAPDGKVGADRQGQQGQEGDIPVAIECKRSQQ